MKANEKDAGKLAELVNIVWPDHSVEELKTIIKNYINSDNSAVFYKKTDNCYIGVALCCLRNNYVDGCETSPVGYLEGISVKEKYRNIGLAKELVNECEDWAREKGCLEFASDCEIDNTASYNFHIKIGFLEQGRNITFKKDL